MGRATAASHCDPLSICQHRRQALQMETSELQDPRQSWHPWLDLHILQPLCHHGSQQLLITFENAHLKMNRTWWADPHTDQIQEADQHRRTRDLRKGGLWIGSSIAAIHVDSLLLQTLAPWVKRHCPGQPKTLDLMLSRVSFGSILVCSSFG